MSRPTDVEGPRSVQRRFFDSLVGANTRELAGLLTDDFVMADVPWGHELPREDLLDAVASQQLRFGHIDVVEYRLLQHGDTAIIIGRTSMRGWIGSAAWLAWSRFTHVFVVRNGRWWLAAARGTGLE